MFKIVCAQQRARAKRKAIFELRAATILKKAQCMQVGILLQLLVFAFLLCVW